MKKIKNYSVVSASPENIVQPIRILLVDDQDFVRHFISKSLELDSDLEIIDTANNGQEAIVKVKDNKPDVILIDIEMPGMDGISATKIITERYPECRVLVLSSHETGDYLQKALNAGATGYLIKGSPAQELSNAIHSIYLGYAQLSPGLLKKAISPPVEIVPETVVPETYENIDSEIQAESDWAESTRENINSLPRVSLRAIFYLLLLLMAGLIPWSAFAKIDEVGTATGKLEPKGRVVDVGSSVDGKVVSISVREGEQVAANGQIMELDSEIVDSEIEQQTAKLQGQQNQINQLELLENQQQIAIRTQQQQNLAQKSEKKALIEQAEKAVETSQSDRKTAIIRYQAAKTKVPRYQKAYDQGVLSKDLLLEARQEADEYQESVKQTSVEIERSRSALAEQKRGLNSLIQTNELAVLKSQEERKEIERQIAMNKAELAQTQSLIAGLEYQMQQRTIHAPIEGTVFQLPVKKPGAVVQTGQIVAKVAPKGSPLVFRGRVSSTDSGFLKLGLPVKLKFDAYPFQDYGVVPGRLTWISPDSHFMEGGLGQGQGQAVQPQEFYEVEIELDRNYVSNHKRKAILTPGQTATAEVVIRQRRLIDIFLEPFRSLQKGGIQL